MISKQDKIKARSQVMIAKDNGTLMPQPCEVCGETNNIEAHHIDYNNPLEVRWLCKHHHMQEHNMGSNLSVIDEISGRGKSKRTAIYWTPEVLNLVDRWSNETGLSRSEIVRICIYFVAFVSNIQKATSYFKEWIIPGRAGKARL